MRLQRHISGERVYEALKASPRGMQKQRIADETGLSLNQVQVGVVWIRDVAASEHSTPVTWTREAGYQVDPAVDICQQYEYAQLHSKLVGLTRLMRGTVGPHATAHPNDEWAQRASRIITGTCDSLELLLERSQS